MTPLRRNASSNRRTDLCSGPASEPQRIETGSIRVLRFRDVRDRTGLSRSTIWRLERRGMFPPHRQISPNAVGWLEDELNDWIRTRNARHGGFVVGQSLLAGQK